MGDIGMYFDCVMFDQYFGCFVQCVCGVVDVVDDDVGFVGYVVDDGYFGDFVGFFVVFVYDGQWCVDVLCQFVGVGYVVYVG